MLNAGITGVRGYAAVHHQQIARLENAGRVSLKSVVVPTVGGSVDASAEDLAGLETRGVTRFESLESMISDGPDLDVVFLPVGIPLHHRFSIQCLEAGINVVCEKPLAGSVSQADDMIKARDRTGKRLVIGYQHMYHPAIDFIHGLRASNAYGRLKRADTLVLWPRDTAYFTRNRWAGRFMVDGVHVRDCPLNNACAHFMQNMLFVTYALSGIPRDIRVVRADNFRSASIETADTQDTEAEGPDGERLRMMVTHACETNSNAFAVYQFEDKHVYWLQEGLVFVADAEATPRFSDREALRDAASTGAYGVHAVYDGSTFDVNRTAFDSIVDGLANGTELQSEVQYCRAHTSIVEQALPDGTAVEKMPQTELRVRTPSDGSPVHQAVRPGIEEAARRAFCGNRPLTHEL
ncbi:MAG: Gfo/Idh/MocA family protein [bacterium]